jgi:hypothetical protein
LASNYDIEKSRRTLISYWQEVKSAEKGSDVFFVLSVGTECNGCHELIEKFRTSMRTQPVVMWFWSILPV